MISLPMGGLKDGVGVKIASEQNHVQQTSFGKNPVQ